jgi:hypothetical protein
MSDLNDISKSLLQDLLQSSNLKLVNIGGIEYVENTSGTLYKYDQLKESSETGYIRDRLNILRNIQAGMTPTNGFNLNLNNIKTVYHREMPNAIFMYLYRQNILQEKKIDDLSKKCESLEKLVIHFLSEKTGGK